MSFGEVNYENAVIELFRDTLGYSYVHGPDVERDYTVPLYEGDLLLSLSRVNPDLPEVALAEAANRLHNIEGGSLEQRNQQFMDYLQNGISVDYFDGQGQRGVHVDLVDYADTDRNSFVVGNQWTVDGKSVKRPDVVVFVNGLPVVVVELKSPFREDTDASHAYRQLKNYMLEIPSLFVYNAFLAMSDLSVSKAGTITSDEGRYMEWKTKDGSHENQGYAQYSTFFEGMFEKSRLLDIIKNFICYSGKKKVLAGYHQYFAVRKAVATTVRAAGTDGKGGVFWHTQGSGKSLSMVFYAHLLQEELSSPTIVVLTDRNDLDDQLSEQFSACADFLRQKPERAESRIHLRQLLEGRQANGIIFTTMQKFEETAEALSKRKNIVVMADEAHRGQYGLAEKVDSYSGRITLGTARIIRDGLPKATYIGFTGTPISTRDRSTIEVFGDYIDVYDMTQAVKDGATRPVYYESRVIALKLDEGILGLIDAEYDAVAERAVPYAIEKSKQELGKLDSILGADETIHSLCEDIVQHYEDHRRHLLTGKAMIVAYSRPVAMRIYRKLLDLRPDWKEMLGVVMTSTNDDPEDWRKIIGNKRHKEEMAEKFKDDAGPLKIAIVVDMWLTGFDVPSLATMYIYKQMVGHGLMQAIARVNRVFGDKEGGLIVDYVGLAKALKQAMKDYTSRDRKHYGDTDIAKTALPKFMEKLEVCRSLLHGFDYAKFLSKTATDGERAGAISGGSDFLAGPGKTEQRGHFLKETMLLRQALSLCRSLVSVDGRMEATFFEAVRVSLARFAPADRPLSLKEINDRVNELLKASIKSEGVINLFADIQSEFSLFDDKFLGSIANMKERNLAIEILRKLLAEQVSLYRRTNIVKSEKFSERLARVMNSYINGLITHEECLNELIQEARDVANARAEGREMGLSEEEKAFYDALVYFEGVKEFYEDDVLLTLTHELTDQLRKSRTIDWQRKESARAGMRMMVKRLLKKYKYPPEGMEDAMVKVIQQCELLADGEGGAA